MAAGQPLRGLVGQSMSGQRLTPQGYTYQFPPGSYAFTVPVPGRWKFVLWGPGGEPAISESASGAYCEITRPLTPGQPVALVVAGSPSALDTTATFSDGKVATAGAAATTTPGVATGGDVNLPGSVGGANGLGTGGGAHGAPNGGNVGGAGAPANLPFRGGRGGSTDGGVGYPGGATPGGGSSGAVGSNGGDGTIIAFLVG